MTDKAFPRQKYDPTQAFIVNKPLSLSGETLAVGSLFDKSQVPERRLRQLYDQRYLRMADQEVHPRVERVARVRRHYPEEEVPDGSRESLATES